MTWSVFTVEEFQVQATAEYDITRMTWKSHTDGDVYLLARLRGQSDSDVIMYATLADAQNEVNPLGSWNGSLLEASEATIPLSNGARVTVERNDSYDNESHAIWRSTLAFTDLAKEYAEGIKTMLEGDDALKVDGTLGVQTIEKWKGAETDEQPRDYSDAELPAICIRGVYIDSEWVAAETRGVNIKVQIGVITRDVDSIDRRDDHTGIQGSAVNAVLEAITDGTNTLLASGDCISSEGGSSMGRVVAVENQTDRVWSLNEVPATVLWKHGS